MHGDHMEGLKPLPPPWAAQGGEFIDKAVAAAGSVDSNTKRSQGLLPCVFREFILKAPGSSPLRGQTACAKMAPTRTPPTAVPQTESLIVQAAYPFGHSAIA